MKPEAIDLKLNGQVQIWGWKRMPFFAMPLYIIVPTLSILFLYTGNTVAGGLAIRYKDSTGSMNVVQMVVESGTNKRTGQLWIAAMQKVKTVTKLVYTVNL